MTSGAIQQGVPAKVVRDRYAAMPSELARCACAACRQAGFRVEVSGGGIPLR